MRGSRSRPVFLVPLSSQVRGNLTAARRCDTTTSANPSDGKVATAHLLVQDNSRETSTEKRQKREEKEGANNRKYRPDAPPEGAGT